MKKNYMQPEFLQVNFNENILNGSGNQVNPNADLVLGVSDDLGNIGALLG